MVPVSGIEPDPTYPRVDTSFEAQLEDQRNANFSLLRTEAADPAFPSPESSSRQGPPFPFQPSPSPLADSVVQRYGDTFVHFGAAQGGEGFENDTDGTVAQTIQTEFYPYICFVRFTYF